MKKLIKRIALPLCAALMLAVNSLAAEVTVDLADTMQTSLGKTINDTVQMMAAILPLALTIFGFMFATKKVMKFLKASTT